MASRVGRWRAVRGWGRARRTDRSRLRSHRAQRVPLPPDPWPGRTPAPGHPPGPMSRTRADPTAGPTAHRLDSRPGRRARPQSAGARGRDDAGRPQRPGRHGARLAPGAGPCGVVSALWPTSRELPPAQDRCGPRGAGPGHRRRWGATPGRRRCGDRPAGAGAAPDGGDPAPRLGRAVHRRAGPAALARSRTCPRRRD